MRLLCAIVSMLLLCTSSLSAVSAAENACPFGRSVNVAVLQADRSENQRKIFSSMLSFLRHLGYVPYKEDFSPAFDFSDKSSFDLLHDRTKGGCITFAANGLYEGYSNEILVKYAFRALKERISEERDIDLVLALGDRAAEYAAKNLTAVPVLAAGVSEELAESLGVKGRYSKLHNFHAQQENNRFVPELTVMRKAFNFSTLGVMVSSDPTVRLESGADALIRAARRAGLKVNVCEGDTEGDLQRLKQVSLKRCAAELALSSEAVYISEGNFISDNFFDALSILVRKRIPTFSQAGSAEVSRGALMAMTDESKSSHGSFLADTIRRVHDGKSPEDLPQLFSVSHELSVNLFVAGLMEWRPDFHLLFAADHVFSDLRYRRSGLAR